MKDFEAMQKMIDENKDITPCLAFIDIEATKETGKITFGAPCEFTQKIIDDAIRCTEKYTTIMCIINNEQFHEIKSKRKQ